MGESTVYMGEYEVYMDSHVKRILHGYPCISAYHHLDLGLHGEGDCLDGGGQNLGILMNSRNPNESWES